MTPISHRLFPLLLALALPLSGCALPPKTASPWQMSTRDGKTRVVYRSVPLREASPYSDYRALRRSEFLRHHVPVEASAALVGRQGPYNYDVLYVMEEDRGPVVYGFTFGKFDIDLPPVRLYPTRAAR